MAGEGRSTEESAREPSEELQCAWEPGFAVERTIYRGRAARSVNRAFRGSESRVALGQQATISVMRGCGRYQQCSISVLQITLITP